MKGVKADAQCAENIPQSGATMHTWKMIVINHFMLKNTPAALHGMENECGHRFMDVRINNIGNVSCM